jgi:hypothetical protein
MSMVRAAILELVPSENESAVEAAVVEIAELVAESIRQAGKRAKTTPATAAYAVECVRRSIVRGKGIERRRTTEPDGAVPDEGAEPGPDTILVLLKRVAEQFRSSHPEATEDAVRERLLEFVRREGWTVGEPVIREALGNMAE